MNSRSHAQRIGRLPQALAQRRAPSRRAGRVKAASTAPAAKAVLRFLMVLGVCGLLGLSLSELRRFALSSPSFTLQEVNVYGTHNVSVAEVLLHAPQPGLNVFAIDANSIKETVEAISWVKSATVKRKLPNQLDIVVTEYQPVALVALDGLFYLDEHGSVFRAFQPGDPSDLPVISGLSRAEYVQGRSGSAEQLARGLRFLSVARRTLQGPAAVDTIAEVEVSKLGWVRFTTASGVEVRIGPEPWERALSDYQMARRLAEKGGQTPQRLTVGRDRRAGQVWVLPQPSGERHE